MQRAPLGSGTNKCGCILFSSQSQFMKFHVMLKERLQSSAEPASDPPTELKLNPACKNSIRHKKAPAKDIHWVPFLPPQTKTSDTLYVTGILTYREARWKSWEYFRHSHPPPEAQRTISAKVLSLLLSGNFRQTDCSMCPATFLMTFGICTKALQKCFVKASAELTQRTVVSNHVLCDHFKLLSGLKRLCEHFRKPNSYPALQGLAHTEVNLRSQLHVLKPIT